jgi:hypothetical protein
VRGIRLGHSASIALNNREIRWLNDTVGLPRVPAGDPWSEHSIRIPDFGPPAIFVGVEADLTQISPRISRRPPITQNLTWSAITARREIAEAAADASRQPAENMLKALRQK